MQRTTKGATDKRKHHAGHEKPRSHLNGVIDTCNFARRLKTQSSLTSNENVRETWTSEPDHFIPNPIQQTPGLINAFQAPRHAGDLLSTPLRMVAVGDKPGARVRRTRAPGWAGGSALRKFPNSLFARSFL